MSEPVRALASASERYVAIERRGAVEWITLSRPRKLNALSGVVLSQLSAALVAAEEDDDVKVVVLAGVDEAFSVGYDIAEEVALGIARAEEWHAALTSNVAVTMQVWGLEKPVIAAISGWCLAGGCEIAMACDMVVAADSAQLGEPEIRFGSGPVTLIMPFVVGQKKTNELLFTGDVIDATTAKHLGMVNEVVPADELEPTVTRLAEKIALTPLPILKLTKRALKRGYEAMGLRTAVEGHIDLAAVLNATYTQERAEFTALVAEHGLPAALAWRDARYAAVEP
jgi:enoyl-CoA hydratase